MSDDPFAGLSLTDATKPSDGLDQRLFAAQAPKETIPPPEPKRLPPPPIKPVEPTPARTPEPIVRVNGAVQPSAKPAARPTAATPSSVPFAAAKTEQPLSAPETKRVSRFDINERPFRKDSFNFTDPEFDRLEDLKLELRRRFTVSVTKNDIARVALHFLYEDYAHDPAKSFVLKMLRTKRLS
ncbi:MAG: hypothetical protein ACKVT1_08595 [Dehalococcoidia bacterium]